VSEILGLLFVFSLGTWVWILFNWLRGKPVLVWQRRRPVPWSGLDVLVIFFLFHWPLILSLFERAQDPVVVRELEHHWEAHLENWEAHLETRQSAGGLSSEETVAHPVFELLKADRRWSTLILCIVVAVGIAPIAEEFIFRLVIQGWLMARESRWRHRVETLRLVPRGWLPVGSVALWFAFLHSRSASEVLPPDQIRAMLVAVGVLQAFGTLTAFGFLRLRYGVGMRSLGIHRERLGRDLRIGLLAFLAVAPPLLVLQELLTPWLEKWRLAADPLPIFFLGIALGVLLYRTGRIVPSIVLHMGLNALSILLAWLSLN